MGYRCSTAVIKSSHALSFEEMMISIGLARCWRNDKWMMVAEASVQPLDADLYNPIAAPRWESAVVYGGLFALSFSDTYGKFI